MEAQKQMEDMSWEVGQGRYVRERIDCKPNWLMGIEGDVVSCLYENAISNDFLFHLLFIFIILGSLDNFSLTGVILGWNQKIQESVGEMYCHQQIFLALHIWWLPLVQTYNSCLVFYNFKVISFPRIQESFEKLLEEIRIPHRKKT